MALAIKSNTSPFYHHYRQFSKRSAAINRDSDYQGRVVYKPDGYKKVEGNEEAIRQAVKSLDFYDKYLITEYYYGGRSIHQISETTDINASTLSKDIKKALYKIKAIIEKDIEL